MGNIEILQAAKHRNFTGSTLCILFFTAPIAFSVIMCYRAVPGSVLLKKQFARCAQAVSQPPQECGDSACR